MLIRGARVLTGGARVGGSAVAAPNRPLTTETCE